MEPFSSFCSTIFNPWLAYHSQASLTSTDIASTQLLAVIAYLVYIPPLCVMIHCRCHFSLHCICKKVSLLIKSATKKKSTCISVAVKVEAVLSLSGRCSITHIYRYICVYVCAEFLSQAILNMHDHLFHQQAV